MGFLRQLSGRRAVIDLSIVLFSCVAITVALIEVEFVEALYAYSRDHEEWELDELIALLVPVSLMLAWFAWRRWRESAALVDELRRNQAQLSELRDQAEQANIQKSRFMANMSHEIRTPMNGVLGMSDLLRQSELSDRQQHFVDTIATSANTLLSVIDSILDFSRIEAGGLQLDCAPFNLHRAVDQVVSLITESAVSKGLEINYFVDAPTPTNLLGDVSRLRQILVNLLANAVKFTDAGSIALEVAVGEGEEHAVPVVFTVTDTGAGIAPENLERLFQPFQRADDSTARRHGGTGLGLAITRQLVELMGGKIKVGSDIARGSTFQVTIPFARSPKVVADPQIQAEALEGLRALVVDDNATNREVITYYLKGWNVEVEAAKAGARALHMLRTAAERERPYDIVLLDLLLPDMSGLELAGKIKDDPVIDELPLVIVTSVTWSDDRSQMRDRGIDGILTKPVKQSELYEVVARLAGRQADHTKSEKGEAEVELCCSVLLVEDDPVNVVVAEGFLNELGCEVLRVATGAEAVAAFAASRFDVVLMDCHLPELDGYAATRQMRAREEEDGRPSTPIIAITASASETDRQRCEAAGMDDFVAKPFTVAELRAALLRHPPTQAAAIPSAGPSGEAASGPQASTA